MEPVDEKAPLWEEPLESVSDLKLDWEAPMVPSEPGEEERPEEPKKSACHHGSNLLAFCLMPFVCFGAFGLPGVAGAVISRFSLFAPNAFYILCGYHAARLEKEESDVYARTLRRTFRRFLLMLLVLTACNVLAYGLVGALGQVASIVLTKRTLFDFFVLCIWPFQIGEPLWFLQSLLYGRVLLWGMHRFGLMRRYKLIMLVCFLLTLLCGEFSQLIGLRFLGYSYIPANAITRALPYMLLGRWIHEKDLTRWNRAVCISGFLFGVAAAYVELSVLGRMGCLRYTGHMIGFGLMAFFACCYALRFGYIEKNIITRSGRAFAWDMYFASGPVLMILLPLGSALPGVFAGMAQNYIAFLVLFVSFGLALGAETFKLRRRKVQRKSVDK